MTSVVSSPPEQGQLVSVCSRRWIVNDIRASQLPSPDLKPSPASPQHLLTLSTIEDDTDEAREQALKRAEAGEKITTAVAREILAKTRKKQKRRTRTLPPSRLGRLVKVLERDKERWQPTEISDLARQLREFADELDGDGKE